MKQKVLILTILIFWLLNFLGITNFSFTILLIVLLPSFIKAMALYRNYKDEMSSPFLLVMIGLLLSSISSMIYEGQTLGQCFNGLAELLTLFFIYYALKTYKVESNVVISALNYASIIYCLFYIINYILISTTGFALIEVSDEEMDKGLESRLRIPGSMLVSYLFFSSLNKFILYRNKQVPLVCILLSASVILIMAFRTMIAGICLCAMLELIIIKGFKKSTIYYTIFAAVLLFIIYNIPVFQQKIEYMVEKQKDSSNTFEDEDYIRWITFDYFINDFFKSPIEMLLGSGPTGFDSNYTKRLKDLQDDGIYTVDWGLIGDAWIYGITTVLGWIWFSVKMIKRKWTSEYKYLSILYIYLLIISITTVEFSRRGNFVIHGVVLYLFTVLPQNIKKCE